MILMNALNEEIIKMRYIALVRKGVIEDSECGSYTRKMDIDPCIKRKVKSFEDYFVPGTVLLPEARPRTKSLRGAPSA